MDSDKYNGTVEEAGLEIESEFYVKTNLVDFSTEFKRKVDCLGGGGEDETNFTNDDRKMRQKTLDLPHTNSSHSDEQLKNEFSDTSGHSAINLEFEKYF
jgi:hypothetical protein